MSQRTETVLKVQGKEAHLAIRPDTTVQVVDTSKLQIPVNEQVSVKVFMQGKEAEKMNKTLERGSRGSPISSQTVDQVADDI